MRDCLENKRVMIVRTIEVKKGITTERSKAVFVLSGGLEMCRLRESPYNQAVADEKAYVGADAVGVA